jgi:putative ABC transport system permease protein
MIKNYLKTAIRNFFKHKSFTFLNVIGLSLGNGSQLAHFAICKV